MSDKAGYMTLPAERKQMNGNAYVLKLVVGVVMGVFSVLALAFFSDIRADISALKENKEKTNSQIVDINYQIKDTNRKVDGVVIQIDGLAREVKRTNDTLSQWEAVAQRTNKE